MATVDSRNASAKAYVNAKIKEAAKFQPNSTFLKTYSDADAALSALVATRANGFRGVVLTVIVGMYLDKNFNPTVNFYDCNPRSIFEKGIYYALTESGIPCGKSDPLNVAKNAQQLDIAWARGKRPESASNAVVKYINLLWKNKCTPKFEELVSLFFLRLYEYGEFVKSQNINVSFQSVSYNGTLIAYKLSNFVIDCAEGGALTQFVVGLLISKLRKSDIRYKSVEGFNESVFGTNTTGKKPADVWEVKENGEYGKLYEITVKVIDEKRLDDCIGSLTQQGITESEVIFICNLTANVSSLNVTENYLLHNGFVFQFVDIKSFINSIFTTLEQDEQREYIEELQDFVFMASRAVATKQYWANNFSNL